MTSKTWAAGTVIDHSWLQDVNDIAYGLPSNVVGKGASLVALQDVAGNFPTDNVEAALATIVARSYGVNVLKYGADPTGVADSSAAFALAFATGLPVYAPTGIYKAAIIPPTHSELLGDGMFKTFLKPIANSASVILLDATSIAKQWCKVHDLQIYNPSALTNCIGLEFRGTNVSSINDMHRLWNLEITDLLYGVRVTGRHIGCHWENIEVLRCDVGYKCSTDPASLAFIFNQFTLCLFNDNRKEGMRIENISLTNKFQTCNWQNNNTLAVVGVAGLYMKDQRNTSFDTCYIENNASGVAIDAANPANNSIGLWLDGTSISQRFDISNSWVVGSGTCIYITANPLYSGRIANTTINPSGPTGWAFVCTSPNNGTEPFIYDPTTMIAQGKVNVQAADLSTAVGFTPMGFQVYYQNGAGVGPVIDMFKARSYTINNTAVAMTISTINNMQPGMELTIVNTNTATITIAAALSSNGSALVVPASSAKKFVVVGFPAYGKLAML